jgi:aryl-alcohol dehydrogenase-like predicted oxidoreductase
MTSGRKLGGSGLVVPPMGIGTNQWGSRKKDQKVVFETFAAAVSAGLGFIDTAEVYGFGESERNIGAMRQRDPRPVMLCTKFAPYPARWSHRSLLKALDRSLLRLQTKSVDLYLIHFPFSPMSIESLMDAMAEAHGAGKIRAIGVSNFNARQMARAASRLATRGLALAANEVQYSLLHRQPEEDGVLQACKELNVSLIAYFPLGSGLLLRERGVAQKFSIGERRMVVGDRTPAQLQGLQAVLRKVAEAHQVTVGQVALNWLLARDERVIVIPGATSPGHVRDNARALEWTLTAEEFAAIDVASRRVAI